jgi:hypothetical protein
MSLLMEWHRKVPNSEVTLQEIVKLFINGTDNMVRFGCILHILLSLGYISFVASYIFMLFVYNF